MMQLVHRAAFVTGAAQGLGKAFSEALLERGARVCLADIQTSKGKQVEGDFQRKYGEDKVFFVHCNAASASSLQDSFGTAVSKFGHIDLMVNNAGIGDEGRLEDMVNVNLMGAVRGTMLALEHMRKDKGGKGGVIVNVASTAGLVGVYFTPYYCATKFGLVGFHKSMAGNPHNAEMGLQFGCLCPAFTDTPIIDFTYKEIFYKDEGLKFIKKLGINKVETVVQGFLQLVEDENCNGDIITVTAKDGVQYQTRRGKRMSRL